MKDKDQDRYKLMLWESYFPWCWSCGRGVENKPSDWFGPWLVERAHIVNNPRREDRRAVILLCSWCHRLQHGEQLALPGCEALRLTVPSMLWLKATFDREYYDRDFLQNNCIGKLPTARCNKQAFEAYCRRRSHGRLLSSKERALVARELGQ